MTSKTANKFLPEVRSSAVRMVRARERAPSRWAAVTSIAAKIGCTPQTLHDSVKKAEVDTGQRAGVPTDMAEKFEGPRAGELRQANEILRKARAYFATAEVDRRFKHDRVHRRSLRAHGVGPICKVLPIAPSTYHAHVAKRSTACARSGLSSSAKASMLPVAPCRD